MTWRGMRSALAALLVACLGACSTLERGVDVDPDAPEGPAPSGAFKDAPSYAAALQVWHGPEDVNAWIGARFRYDTARAMQLSETQRQQSAAWRIHAPDEFFAAPSGVCVDLARFTVETLRQTSPELGARYLRIEFSPLAVRGNTLRVHWMASFTRDGQHWFFGDSKRPGHIAGPYPSTEAFMAEYSAYRGRAIVAFDERDGYRRVQRRLATGRARAHREPQASPPGL